MVSLPLGAPRGHLLRGSALCIFLICKARHPNHLFSLPLPLSDSDLLPPLAWALVITLGSSG